MSAQPAKGSSPGAKPDATIGRKIGNYRIIRKIGEGGMGTVYEATHTTLGRRTAIKTLRRGVLPDASAAARFFTEAKAISMVSHPCLVTIYEHGTHPSADGGEAEAYIAMEYLEGESLRSRLDKRYLGASALGLLRQLVSALAVTHKGRIIHRDLKPDNIMLVADDTVSGGVRAKILDFGLAKLLPPAEQGEGDGKEARPEGAAAPAPASSVPPPPDSVDAAIPRSVKTRTGMLIGTPMYMSPEQCYGSASPDDKTDVYSLGLIFFELLYGDPPFLSRSAAELYAMHMFFPAPSLQELVPQANPRLVALIGRMLDKKAASRPTMEEILAELQLVPDTGLVDGPAEQRPSARKAKEALAQAELGPSGKLRHHLEQLSGKSQVLAGDGASSGASGASGPVQSSQGGSLGEQITPLRPPMRSGVLALAGIFVMLLMTVGAVAVRLHRKGSLLSAAPAAAVQPAPPAAAPPPTPPSAPPAPPAMAATPGTPGQAAGAAARPQRKSSQASRDKTARKTGNEPKKAKGNYDVHLWN